MRGLLLHAIVHSAGVQDRDGGIWLLATLFGQFPFLAKLFADSAYAGPIFDTALDKVLPNLKNQNRQTLRSCQRVRSVTQALEAIAFLLSLHEMVYPGRRRAFGIIIFILAIWIMIVSKSKWSLAMAIMTPFLAKLIFIIGNKMRISPAVVLLPIVFWYEAMSKIPGANVASRISWWVYQNYTLSGRTVIWDFVSYEIARRPLLGCGYQSFWLVGPDAPSIVEAPGWVKNMPSGNSSAAFAVCIGRWPVLE
jgi:hypothetical protein